MQQVLEPQVGSVDDLVADLLARGQDSFCVGDGALRYADELRSTHGVSVGEDAAPSARHLVQLAHAKALREEWETPAAIQPLYLRPPDADINWAARR